MLQTDKPDDTDVRDADDVGDDIHATSGRELQDASESWPMLGDAG